MQKRPCAEQERGKVLTDQKKVKSMGAHTVRSRIADHSAADCDANNAHALELPPPVSSEMHMYTSHCLLC